MDEATEKELKQKLAEAEQYSEKIKAEFFISLGKVAALKELLQKKETKNAI